MQENRNHESLIGFMPVYADLVVLPVHFALAYPSCLRNTETRTADKIRGIFRIGIEALGADVLHDRKKFLPCRRQPDRSLPFEVFQVRRRVFRDPPVKHAKIKEILQYLDVGIAVGTSNALGLISDPDSQSECFTLFNFPIQEFLEWINACTLIVLQLGDMDYNPYEGEIIFLQNP